MLVLHTWDKFDLDPSFLSFVKGLVGVDSFAYLSGLSENLLGVGHPTTHQFHQLRNILAVVAVAHIDREVLVHCYANWEELICRWINPDNGEGPSLGYRLYCPLSSLRRRIARVPVAILWVGLWSNLL